MASAVIADIERVEGPPALLNQIATARAAAAKVAVQTPCSACKSGFHSYAASQLYHITFTETLPAAVRALTLFNADNISNVNAVIVSARSRTSSSAYPSAVVWELEACLAGDGRCRRRSVIQASPDLDRIWGDSSPRVAKSWATRSIGVQRPTISRSSRSRTGTRVCWACTMC